MKALLIFLISITCVGVLLVAASVLRVLKTNSLFEIRSRVKQKDQTASLMYPLFTHRGQVAWLAKASMILAQLSLVTIISWDLWAPFAIVLVAAVLLVGGYIVFFSLRDEQAERITAKVAPYIQQLLTLIKPLTDFIKRTVTKQPYDVSLPFHSKEELIHLVKQSESSMQTLSSDERGIVSHALTFSDKIIADVMIPRRIVKGVNISDEVNLRLLNELHDTGFSRFPVFEESLDNVVGTLYLKNLVGAAKGNAKKVKDVYDKQVYFVNQNQTLDHVLNAFLRTKHHLFIVVNEFQEMTGVITIEDIIEQMMGRKIIDEFDKYDDLRLVAAMQAKKLKKDQKDPTETSK